MKYGLQLYSIGDKMQQDMDAALRAVAEMGYSFVEFAGFHGKTAEEVNELLAKHGLTLSGTHTGWNEITDNFEETVKYHKAIGNKHIIVPYWDMKTKAKIDEFVDSVNKFQPMLEAEGIALSFHNHCDEFLPNEDGLIAHEELEKRTNIGFQIDMFWAFFAKRDPVELITRLKDRIKCIHLKDGRADNGNGRALGDGDAPVAAVRECASKLGLTMVVESESQGIDSLEGVKKCIDYLKSLD